MISKNKFTIEDIFIDLSKGYFEVQHSENIVFNSFNIKYLDTYKQGQVNAKDFGYFGDIENDSYWEDYVKNYKRFLGIRHIHLGSLFITGFLNTSYGVSFCFEVEEILSEPHLICDHDSLACLLLYGREVSTHELFQEKYTEYCEILTQRLELKKSCLAIVYSDEAANKVRKKLGTHLKIINVSELRKKAVDMFCNKNYSSLLF